MAEEIVWIVDDDESMRWVLERACAGAGLAARSFPGGAELLDALEQARPDVLLCDLRMPGIDGLALLARVRASHPRLPIVIMTAHSDLDSAVAALKGGAFEYLAKPFDLDEATALLARAAGAGTGGSDSPPVASPAPAIIGEAPAMQNVFRAIGRLAGAHVTVLVTGESGTGKELVARALHQHSPRAGKPFIAVNTAATPKDLMESEFFGHEKGAFTGATAQRRGRFEQAHGGSLFLDEIGDMPAELQTRLLRVLQDGQFYRVGGHAPVTVDVRIIAATNRELEREVAAGGFREDLYHRLNVIRLRLPPLRERRADIPLLLAHFLARAARELGAEPKRLRPASAAALAALDWPGNVRQLENLCRWLTVMAPGREVMPADLPPELTPPGVPADAPLPADVPLPPPAPDAGATGSTQEAGPASPPPPTRPAAAPSADPIAAISWDQQLARWAQQRLAAGGERLTDEAGPAFERALIRVALVRAGGHRQKAARLLGWGRNTLTRKIKELGIDAEADA